MKPAENGRVVSAHVSLTAVTGLECRMASFGLWNHCGIVAPTPAAAVSVP